MRSYGACPATALAVSSFALSGKIPRCIVAERDLDAAFDDLRSTHATAVLAFPDALFSDALPVYSRPSLNW
jgi:hypothetical protein